MPASPAEIEVEQVRKQYGLLTALDATSFSVDRGELVAILGPSGCGKTTLLRMLGGLLEPSGGRISVAGAELYGGSGGVRGNTLRQIGFVFQDPTLMPWRRVLRNVMLPLELQGRGGEFERARDLLRLVGLDGFEGHYPRQLSGGMRQRVAIARALAHDPRILLMDEPFGALDAMTRDSMNMELQRIWMASGKTIMLVTHSIPEAVFLADRVFLLTTRPGRVQSITKIDFPRPRALELLGQRDYQDVVSNLRRQLEAHG